MANLGTELLQLYAAGARNFLVPNMPDLALTPSGLSQAPGNQLALHALSVGFNSGLAGMLDTASALPGINLVQFDTFGFFNTVIANPAAFGLTNVTSSCFYNGAVCSDPGTYLFWDSVHPTTAGAARLGDAFSSAVVPEPTSLLLLGTGILGAMRAVRRRRA